MNLDFSLEIDSLDKVENHKTLYEILDIPRSATTYEVKQAYIKQTQIHNRNSLALYSLTDEAANNKSVETIEHAFSILSCDFSRERYDKELRGETLCTTVPNKTTTSSVTSILPEKRVVRSQDELMSYFDALSDEHGLGTGSQLKSFREWLGLDIQEVQQVTKISYTNLTSIENESFQLLPDIVYVRGFLRNCLRYYGLPETGEFEKSFMERFTKWKQTSNQ